MLLLGGVNAACRPGPFAPPTVMPIASAGAPAQVWRSNVGRRFTGRMVVRGATVYGGGLDRKVYAIDLGNGQPRWSSRLGGLIGGGVLVSGDTVYAASSRPDGRLYALDARTGHRLWRTATGPVGAELALIDGVIVVETQLGEVLGVSAATGDVRWRRRLGVARTPATPADSGTLIVATVDSLFRLRVQDGGVVRRRASPGAIVSSWIAHRGALVAGTTDSLMVAIDPDDLRTRWRATLDAPVLVSPAASGDTIYAASRRGTLYRIVADSAVAADARTAADSTAFGAADGSAPPVSIPASAIAELRWPVTAPVTMLDGLVILGGADGTLRALRPDGREAWRIQLQWPVELGPLRLDDGMLAIGGHGDLHRYGR